MFFLDKVSGFEYKVVKYVSVTRKIIHLRLEIIVIYTTLLQTFQPPSHPNLQVLKKSPDKPGD